MARTSHWKQPPTAADEEDTTADADPSMTFLIPSGHETRLLDMGNDDFLDELNDSFGSPQRTMILPSISQPPLTLEELTPRKRLRHGLQDALATNMYAESTPFLKREKFSPMRRLRSAEDEENVEPQSSPEAEATTFPRERATASSPKRTLQVPSARVVKQDLVREGNVAGATPSPVEEKEQKVFSAPPPPTELPEIVSHAGAPDMPAAAETRDIEVAEPNRRLGHARVPSSSNVGGAKAKKPIAVNATRSKKVAPAPVSTARPPPAAVRQAATRPIAARAPVFRPPVREVQPTKETAPTPSSADNAGVPPQASRSSSPLTLSQLSPSKQVHDIASPTEPSARSGSPEQLATCLEQPELQPQDTFTSSAAPQTASTVGQPSEPRALDATPPTAAPATAGAPRAFSSKPKAPVKTLAGKPQAKKQQPRRRSSVQRNYCVPSVASKQKAGPQPSALASKRRAALLSDNSGQRQAPALGASADRGKPSSDRLTKPVAFRFQVDSRLSARKHEKAPDAATRARDPSIPDFAARHAVEAERIHMRKEQIAPTVPQPLEFVVDARLREREKYEEGRRAREAEIEQTREEARLEREREEEAAISRMRKLAVPKANAVPEWYAHAPKKGSRSASTSSSGPA